MEEEKRNLKLKFENQEFEIQVYDSTPLEEIKQIVFYHEFTKNSTCFHFEFKNSKVDSLIGDIANFDYQLNVVPSVYTLLELKAHLRAFGLFSTDIIQISNVNAPISRKLKGDLLYLSYKSSEITCSVNGFYVNSSKDGIFNPVKKSEVFNTIPDLVKTIDGLELKKIVPRESFYMFYPWLEDDKPSKNNSLKVYFESIDAIDTLVARDWNDDIQSCLEISSESASQKVMRDQVYYRTLHDFQVACLKGVMQIVQGNILPINSGEAESSIYLHNSIFFSKGYDNREQFDQYGGVDAAHVAVSKDIDGIEFSQGISMLRRLESKVCTLGTLLVDFKGERFVCQSIVPGILKKASNEESSIQYGSIDGGLEIVNSSIFEQPALDLATSCRLKKHTLVDAHGVAKSLHTPIDCKWVLGTDSRKYVLDLYRLTPVDVSFLEEHCKSENAYPHEMVLLRPELLELFYSHKLRAAIQQFQEQEAAKEKESTEEKTEDVKKAEQEERIKNFKFTLEFNTDVFTHAKLGDSPEEIKKDEDLVREASGFISVVISQLIIELTQGGVIPSDSTGIVSLFHNRGINMRYLGKVCSLFDQLDIKALLIFKKLLKDEMVARACKHILRNQLESLELYKTPALISEFLTHLFANDQEIQEQVRHTVQKRFRYSLPADYWIAIDTNLLRSICLKVGIQLRRKEYSGVILEDDIIALVPVTKSPLTTAGFAAEALEHGKLQVAQDKRDAGIDLVREAVSMYEQVYGTLHPQTGKAYASLAMLCFNSDQVEQAVEIQKRAVEALEKTLGDDIECIKQQMNLAYFEFGVGADNAVPRMERALNAWLKVCGSQIHPETSSAYANYAAMLQKTDLKKSLQFWEKSCQVNLDLFGFCETTAASYETLTRVCFAAEDYRKALDAQKVAFKSYKALGDEEKIKISNGVMQNLTARAVEAAKIAKKQAQQAPEPIKTKSKKKKNAAAVA